MLSKGKQSGFTMVEILVAVLIAGILFGVGIPSFREWIQNSKVRNGAESVMGGLQLARAEAVRRNTNVQMVLSPGSGVPGFTWRVECVPAASGVISSCADAASGIQAYSSAEGAQNVQIDAAASIVFNGFGRVTPVPVSGVSVDVSSTSPGASCISAGGKVRCLRIVVTGGGLIRMCDPAISRSTTTPQGC